MHSMTLWKEKKKDQRQNKRKLIRFRCPQRLFKRKRKKDQKQKNEKLIRFRCTQRLWLKIGDQGLAVWLADALSEAATCNLTQPVQIQTKYKHKHKIQNIKNIADPLSVIVAPATCNLTKYTSKNTKRLADILSDVAAHSPCHVQLDPTSLDVRGPKRNEMTNTNTK